jgi:hypothetical protein
MSEADILCPICAQACEITEEDLIDADCGACGSVTIHVHCKEKYCKQQGLCQPSPPPLCPPPPCAASVFSPVAWDSAGVRSLGRSMLPIPHNTIGWHMFSPLRRGICGLCEHGSARLSSGVESQSAPVTQNFSGTNRAHANPPAPSGIPKGQYKGYTCPQCTKAKVSAQHLRQKVMTNP